MALGMMLPCGALAATANPSSLSFTGATFGGAPQSLQVTFTLDALDGGSGTVNVNPTGPEFTATASCSGSTCTATVTFTPQAAGTRTATLVFTPATPLRNPTNVPLSGTTAPGAALAAPGLAFGAAQTGTTTAGQATTITNSGNAPLTISAIALAGADADQFTLGYCGPTPISLPAGGSCFVGAVFAPTTAGAKSAAIVISDDAGQQSVALSGIGVDPPPPPVIPSGAPPPPPTVDEGPGGGSTAAGLPLASIHVPKARRTLRRTRTVRRKGRRVQRTRILTFKGLASDTHGLLRVEMALTRGKGSKCRVFDGKKSMKKGSCTRPRFVRTRLDDFDWSYRLPSKARIAAGTYTLVVRSIDLEGNRSENETVSFRIE